MVKTDKPYHIHFVCRGNIFRSRMAAAYFHNLIDAAQYRVDSSGIDANKSASGVVTIEPYTQAVAEQFDLHHGIRKHKVQTTNKLLDEADVIIFLNKDVYEDALKAYQFDVRKALVWHVADIDDRLKQELLEKHDSESLTAIAVATFKKIRPLCKQLHEYVTHTAWVDVVDAHNEPTGLRLPMAWITDRGLWHRGIHVVAQTIDDKYVVGKRAKGIVFAPGMLEISLGGGVDTGEHPLRAAARETHEELGVRIPEKLFRPLFMYKQVGYHPHYNKQTKCHLYVYAVRLPVHSSELVPQPGEVAAVRSVSRRQVKHLLHAHRLQHFGRLKWGYKLYNKAVAYSTLPI